MLVKCRVGEGYHRFESIGADIGAKHEGVIVATIFKTERRRGGGRLIPAQSEKYVVLRQRWRPSARELVGVERIQFFVNPLRYIDSFDFLMLHQTHTAAGDAQGKEVILGFELLDHVQDLAGGLIEGLDGRQHLATAQVLDSLNTPSVPFWSMSKPKICPPN